MAVEMYKYDFFEDGIAEGEVMIDCQGVCQSCKISRGEIAEE